MLNRALADWVIVGLLGGFLVVACRDDVTEPRSPGLPPEHPSHSSAALGPPQLLLSGISEGPSILLDDISDDRVAYRTTEGGDIYVFDISERGTETAKTRVTNDGSFHGPGRISGDRVVWSRDQAQLYQFSLVTHVESALGLATDAAYDISGDYVALGESDFGQVSSLHNLVTGETRSSFAIPPADCGNCTWAFSGDRLVFPESYGHRETAASLPTRLFVYDISENSKQPITGTTDDVDAAAISGDRIVYTSSLDGLAYLFDLGTHTARQIPFAGQIVGDHVLSFNTHLDLSTGVQTAIPGGALLSESWIVWASVNETTGFWDLYGIPFGGEDLVVTLSPNPAQVSPVLDRTFDAVNQSWADPLTGVRTDISRLELEVHWEPSMRPAAKAAATLTIEPTQRTGGHAHADRPEGSFFLLGENVQQKARVHRTLEVVTKPDGKATALYRTSGVSGTDTLKVSVTAEGIRADAKVGIIIRLEEGLVRFAHSATGYRFLGSDNHSPEDDYLATGVIGHVNTILADYKAKHDQWPRRYPMTGARFTLTAASLVSGGMYDINGSWRVGHGAGGHSLHRLGKDVDFDDNGAEAARLIMERHCARYTFEQVVTTCELHNGNHFHAYIGDTFYH